MIWRELWMAGVDAPHPENGQSLEQWLETLPDYLLTKMRRRIEILAKNYRPDSDPSTATGPAP